MAKVYIRFLAEDFSLDCAPIKIESDVIPRVDEIINAAKFLKKPHDASPYYIVESVIYEFTKNGFVPHVTGRTWNRGIRSELLQGRGWLPPGKATKLSHDEADDNLTDAPPKRSKPRVRS